MKRRDLLAAMGGATVTALAAPTLWTKVLVSAAPPIVNSPFGPLGAPDANGLRLPPGFSSRVIARTGDPVGSTSHLWHAAPDGGATFRVTGGGWIYVSNAEVAGSGGGVGAISFTSAGEIANAYSILNGTNRNCAGGPTPWGTWLSCEENGPVGQVYECVPTGPGNGVVRPALGSFNHEAAVVDPRDGVAYLTEDDPAGRLYRFVPTVAGQLSTGQLFAARSSVEPASMATGQTSTVTWEPTSSSAPDRSSSTSAFAGGEGEWIDRTRLLFTTKLDLRVWSLDLDTSTLTVLYDGVASPGSPLNAVDNIVVHPNRTDIYVAEDGGNMEVCLLQELAGGAIGVSTFLQMIGQDASEITGPAFSPDGQHLYVSSQRGTDGRGITYDITGPFPKKRQIGSAPAGSLRPARRVGTTV